MIKVCHGRGVPWSCRARRGVPWSRCAKSEVCHGRVVRVEVCQVRGVPWSCRARRGVPWSRCAKSEVCQVRGVPSPRCAMVASCATKHTGNFLKGPRHIGRPVRGVPSPRCAKSGVCHGRGQVCRDPPPPTTRGRGGVCMCTFITAKAHILEFFEKTRNAQVVACNRNNKRLEFEHPASTWPWLATAQGWMCTCRARRGVPWPCRMRRCVPWSCRARPEGRCAMVMSCAP